MSQDSNFSEACRPPITSGDRRMLAIIVEHNQTYGCGPTLRLLAEKMNVRGMSGVSWRVRKLLALKLVTGVRCGRRGQLAARSLSLTEAGRREVAYARRRARSGMFEVDRELSLTAAEVETAERLGMPFLAYRRRWRNGQLYITFQDNRERDDWGDVILESIESTNRLRRNE